MAAIQEVEYEVLDVYKGADLITSNNVLVNHVLVGGGPAMDREPRLVPELFTPGTEVVLFAKGSLGGKDRGVYVFGDDGWGVLFVKNGHLVLPRSKQKRVCTGQ